MDKEINKETKKEDVLKLKNKVDEYSSTKKSELTRNHYLEATQIKPNDFQGWLNLGNNYLGNQDFGKAIDAYEKAVLINSRDTTSIMNIGYTYGMQGNFEEAIKYYQK
ncbi:MAG: tetratricopeptide repeat protein, partial [Candidatus Thorarchaeota archaeon]